MKKFTFVWILIILTAYCYSVTKEELKEIDEEYIDLIFEEYTIKNFIKEISEIIEKEIVIEGEIKGKVNFVSTIPILKSELIPLLNAVLETKRMTLVDKGDYYVVVNSNTALCCLPVNKEEINEPMKSKIFEFAYLDAKTVLSKIKPLLSKNVKAVYIEDENSLNITAYPDTLRSIEKLIMSIREK